MLPPMVRRKTVLPPPFTVPLRMLRSFVPEDVTGRSQVTLPPVVLASRLKEAVPGTFTVMPPPEVWSLTAPGNGPITEA